MTDLEAHVSAKGRKELVKQVRAKINELGINYIYYQFVSVTGRIVGKGIPADHWEIDRRARLPAGLRLDRQPLRRPLQELYRLRPGGLRAGRHSRSRDLRASCPGTSAWRASSAPASAIARRRVNPGGHLTSDCRGNLRIIHEEFQKNHKGLHLRHGCEPEMMWLKKGADGLPDGGFSKPNCYHIDQFEIAAPGLPARDRVLARHGSRHDPGRPRGRAGPARAQLHVRRCAAHRGSAHHLSPDLRPGRARVQPDRLLHGQAVHGRLGQRLPPQSLALARRRGEEVNKLGRRRERPAGHAAELHLPEGRREHLPAAEGPVEAGSDRALFDRRRDQACAAR